MGGEAVAGPEFLLYSKWQSRVSSLWNLKQTKKFLNRFFFAIKLLIHVNFLKSISEIIFSCGLSCAKLPVIFLVKLLFWGMPWKSLTKLLSFLGWIPYFEASNLITFSKVFLEKVSLPKFLIATPYASLALVVFQYNISYQAHSYIFHSMLSI